MKHKSSNEKLQINCKNESFSCFVKNESFHVLSKLRVIFVNCFGSPIHQQLLTLCFVCM
jgi:hypothetical protein